MAELNVQPKKKTSWLPWLIAAIVLLSLIFLLSRGCNDNSNDTGAGADTTSATQNGGAEVGATTPADGNMAGSGNWDNIDRNAPAASYEEITDRNIDVRGNDNYGIYSLGESVLFDTDKSTIRKNAEQNLGQIAASINKRFNGGEVRVYGFTDSVGSAGYNKELAEQRAAAVRSWLAANGGMDSSRISVNPIGEGRPVASNSTEQGRQQNRRVEIIARKAQ
jgi:outer membrane protein OmpA-like peptidoglycan-associated protein